MGPILYEGWVCWPGEIILTQEEYEKYKKRYLNLNEGTRKKINDRAAEIFEDFKNLMKEARRQYG